MANKNRTKGHNAEREYRKRFIELGYDKCQTARYGSRLHDDCMVDLIYIPYSVQVKAGQQRGLKPGKVLRDMDALIKENLPEIEQKYPKLVIHRKEVRRGKARDEFDDIVTMTWEDFKKLL